MGAQVAVDPAALQAEEASDVDRRPRRVRRVAVRAPPVLLVALADDLLQLVVQLRGRDHARKAPRGLRRTSVKC